MTCWWAFCWGRHCGTSAFQSPLGVSAACRCSWVRGLGESKVRVARSLLGRCRESSNTDLMDSACLQQTKNKEAGRASTTRKTNHNTQHRHTQTHTHHAGVLLSLHRLHLFLVTCRCWSLSSCRGLVFPRVKDGGDKASAPDKTTLKAEAHALQCTIARQHNQLRGPLSHCRVFDHAQQRT